MNLKSRIEALESRQTQTQVFVIWFNEINGIELSEELIAEYIALLPSNSIVVRYI